MERENLEPDGTYITRYMYTTASEGDRQTDRQTERKKERERENISVIRKNIVREGYP